MDTPSNDKKSSPIIVTRALSEPSFANDQLSFKGSRFEVRTRMLSDEKGSLHRRDVILHPGAVVILPLLDKETVVMIRNERIAVGKTLWELPAGTLEPKEEPIQTAKRELIEETGYQTDEITPLIAFYTTPGICDEVIYAFVAKKLVLVGQALEEMERITVELLSWKQTLKMIKDEQIVDAKTITTLLFYHSFISETSP